MIYSKTYSINCPLTLTTLSPVHGLPSLAQCISMSGSAFVCSLQCTALPQCKVVYSHGCNSDGSCACSYCNALTDVAFEDNHVQFFLHTTEIGTNTNEVSFPNGLVAGQPLLMKIYIAGTKIILNFISTVGHSAFHTEIRFYESSVVSNSYIGYTWGPENRYTPNFNFYQGQELSVLCVVTSAGYKLYFDNVLFKDFGHRWPINDISKIRISNTGSGVAKFLSFSA
ncbi:hypothetical protein EGW08_004390 [Elysia chlorotica]|uniref:Galectin n=1 Tax=Elysia chlorotica TaxID=188477 RepID=A0A433U212_ELYCH|nr:hypothetical protein EGW08_004390 [Elysia chlorotica]